MQILAGTLLVIAFLFNGSSALAQKYNSTTKTYFTFENLVETLNQKNVRSVEELLPVLPKEFLNDYVLIYKSRSLQDASFKFPRVIMFGNDSSLMMSFNGEKSQRGFDRLEVIQFREATARFEFREIEFDSKARPVVSDANPAKCMKCHQSPTRLNVDMRPNWEPYNIWPGAFGSISGQMTLSDHNSTRFRALSQKNPELKEMFDLAPSEAEGFRVYGENRKSHPRYRHLGPSGPFGRMDIHDNILAFTQRVSARNFKRLGRLMREHELSEKLLPVVESSLRCGKYLNAVLPPQYATALKQMSLRSNFAEYGSDIGASSIAMIFEPFGTDTNDWSTSFNTDGRFAFSSRFGTPGLPDTEFGDAVFAKPSNCDQLEDKISRNFRGPMKQNEIPGESPLTFMNACAKCHSGPAPQAPPISFDNPTALAFELKTEGYPRGTLFEEIKYRVSEGAASKDRMPEGFHLAPHQTKILVDYLSKEFQ